jgi:NADP-dependent 3-hydroxy acid dehydrogenase YdfG
VGPPLPTAEKIKLFVVTKGSCLLQAAGDKKVLTLLFGIAAALPVSRKQESGHFVNVASTAGMQIPKNMSSCGRRRTAKWPCSILEHFLLVSCGARLAEGTPGRLETRGFEGGARPRATV